MSQTKPAYKSETLEAKRQAALNWLGERWILHKNYQHNPKHSYWKR